MKKLYIIQSSKFLKVGISSRVGKRLESLQIGNPIELSVVDQFSCKGSSPRMAEEYAHLILSKHKVRGEWFDCTTEIAKNACLEATSYSHSELHTILGKTYRLRKDQQPKTDSDIIGELLRSKREELSKIIDSHN